MKTRIVLFLASLLAVRAGAQSVLFDFDAAPVHTSLPLSLTVGGITAHFSATGQGFSIQPANSQGFTPAGFAGNCIYPNSVYAADLLVSFSTTITDFSILYAPQELACDASASVQVTAYFNGALVGTGTTNATWQCTCSWPGQTLAFSSTQGFNIVMVHYVAPGPGCQDYGPVFLADNMVVTPAPLPIILTGAGRLPTGEFQFSFTNWPGLTFTAFGATNLTLPFSNWTSLGAVPEVAPGQFQFTDSQTTNRTWGFYRVASP